MKKTFIVLLGLIILGSANLTAKAKKTVLIGSANGGGSRLFSGLLAVAKEYKFLDEEFEKLGYKTEYVSFQNGVAVNEAFLANEVDFAFIGDVPGFTGLTNNIGTIWIAENRQISTVGIAVPKDSKASKPSDFIGKTVAVNIGTNAHFLYGKYFDEAGISPSQFNTVNLTIANGALAVTTHDADVTIGDATVLYPLEKKGDLKIILTTLDRPEWASQTLLLGRKKLLKKNPELGVAFAKAIIRARLLIENTPEKYYNILSANAVGDDLELGNKMFNPDGTLSFLNPEIIESSISRAQALVDYLYSIDRLKEKKDVNTFVDNSYYERALKQLGVKKFN